jgi:hypothetical protein
MDIPLRHSDLYLDDVPIVVNGDIVDREIQVAGHVPH